MLFNFTLIDLTDFVSSLHTCELFWGLLFSFFPASSSGRIIYHFFK